ncbi:ornithine cyclodeaminase family protein [Rouxiella sp. WC2420]|uniref:Ornithine cyclodeaminase family protein n=1 Tax=Rouxiella sp. WC2420 TaxID=3234145 RepID=A0AB39VST9_9GAMM
MRFISAAECLTVVSHPLAFEAVEAAFIAVASAQSTLFPVLIGHGSETSSRFTVKSATQSVTTPLTGLKIGTYWPNNSAKGLPNHNSYIMLLNDETGELETVLEGGKVNAYRTAAADAVAAKYLARPDATRLAIFGAGHQAFYEVDALLEILPIAHVYIVNRDQTRAESLRQHLLNKGIDARLSDAETACKAADIIVTATGSRSPLFQAEWVKPGTHVASMGSDAQGKQELPAELFNQARLFADLPEQSRTIGEFQHLATQFAAKDTPVNAMGDVILGKTPGRSNRDEITVFDSSGIALQDLFIAAAIVNALDSF